MDRHVVHFRPCVKLFHVCNPYIDTFQACVKLFFYVIPTLILSSSFFYPIYIAMLYFKPPLGMPPNADDKLFECDNENSLEMDPIHRLLGVFRLTAYVLGARQFPDAANILLKYILNHMTHAGYQSLRPRYSFIIHYL